MKAKSMILIVIALGCGLVASIGISQVLDSGDDSAPALETTKIFVAADEIDIADKLNEKNLTLDEWPADRIPEGAITKLEDIEGRFTKVRLYKGQAILSQFLANKDSIGIVDDRIPEGFRVVAVKVSVDSAVANLIEPGSRVDVLVFLRRSSEWSRTSTRTILTNVRVFAVNQQTDREVDEDGKNNAAKTISLLVTPEHAEKLMLAGQLGKLHLTLRRLDDTSDTAAGGATLENFLRNGPENADVESPTDTAASARQQEGEELLDILAGKSPTDAGLKPQYNFQMVIHTPDGPKQYKWDDPNNLPQEFAPGAFSAAIPAAPPSFNFGGQDDLGPPPADATPADVSVEDETSDQGESSPTEEQRQDPDF